MNKKIKLVSVLFFLSVLGLQAQTPLITIKWTAKLNGEHEPLDSVVITNQSNGEKMTVYYTDTVFEYYDDLGIRQLHLQSNKLRVYPNPFTHTTQVEFWKAEHIVINSVCQAVFIP